MLQSLYVVDMAMMLAMLVLADLSRRLGEALKIQPYYRFLYVTAALVLIALVITVVHETYPLPMLQLVSMGLRTAAGAAAVLICLPYWRWLFPEFFNRQK